MTNLPKAYSIGISLSLKPKFMLFSLFSFLISIKIILITNNFQLPEPIKIIHLEEPSLGPSYLSINNEPPKWLQIIQGTYKRPLRVGLINIEANKQPLLGAIPNSVTIDLEPVSPNVTWNTLFPGYVKINTRCPEIPMPNTREYPTLDVVVAQLPCGDEYNRSHNEGIRDVHRLQLSLASAHLIVENAIKNEGKHVYGVFISKCEPMVEMFRCDDLIWHQGDYWIYKPKVDKLKEILSMPIGACEVARPYVGALGTRQFQAHPKAMLKPMEAYVTVLHSSDSYVCGAIALAHSILLTNTTKDLVLLVDRTISNRSIVGLQAAGWKIKWIERIRSPFANLTAYNAWNYSKLRIWQLTEYSKVLFIDSDFIVLRNLDHVFNYPQLSVFPNSKFLFNSGIMLLEPSECFFNTLMNRRHTIKSYNGGDQGYLNEIITYWHRLSQEINLMKFFSDKTQAKDRVVGEKKYAIHFLGVKPWACYRDYDCNWDSMSFRKFASDDFHARWWKVYDVMPKELQMYCGMTEERDKVLRQRKLSARLNNHSDGHWMLELNDFRQFNLVGST